MLAACDTAAMTKPGFEEIPLDLSRVPSVEEGLADAAARDRAFVDLAKASLGEGTLFLSHLPLMSFINRAISLHRGIVAVVRAENPHAAFTLLRAYLELTDLVYYVDSDYEYLNALTQPMSELPRHARKSFRDLFEFAAPDMPGVRTVYSVLNEMAHFGSTALWHPFSLDETDPATGTLGTLAFSTGPHWKRPDDARIALAMLREADEVTLEVLRLFAEHHVTPSIERATGGPPELTPG